MKRDSSKKKRTTRKHFKKESQEFNKKKKMLRPSMSKREKLSRNLRNLCNNLNLNLIETKQFRLKNTRILKGLRTISLKLMRLRPKSFKNKITSSTRLFLKEKSALENKLKTGRDNIMIWKDNMLTSRVSLKKKKLSGKESLSSLKNKKSN